MRITLGNDGLAAAAVEAAEAAGAAARRLDVSPVHKASRGFVNESAADVCELAVVTLLQAVAHDKPVSLLPVTMLGRHQHQTLVTMSDLGVGDVPGRTVGVRAWSQTTGVWLRGFLSDQYGVDLREVQWRTYEGGHVDGATDPVWVQRAPEGAKLKDDFLDGRLDFGIMGNELPADDRIRTAIPDAPDAARRWAAEKGFAPINHVVGISNSFAAENPGAVLAVFDALAAAVVPDHGDSGSVRLNPIGFDGLRGPVAQASRYAYEQGLLPRPVEYDELVERTCSLLGVDASRLTA